MSARKPLPPRTDLISRHERVAARVMQAALQRSEQLRSRLLPYVPLPADDPFYRQPSDLEAHRPGELLDIRNVDVRGFRRQIDADAWQVKFGSSDMDGAPLAGVSTVMVPRRHFDGPVRPLLSYQPAIDSLSASADPSYTLRHGDQGELAVMTRALRQGWAVVATDYNGPAQAFGALPLAGRLILDALRAVRGVTGAGIHAGTPIGLWGYSGGAQATLWAAEQHGAYARDLNIVGVAAGGAGVDLVSSPAMFDGGNLLSGIPFGAVVGLSRAFPDIDLAGVLTPHGRAMIEAAADMPVEQLILSFPFIRLSDHLTVPGVLDIPGMRAALAAIRLGKATPIAPMYLYHAIRDQYPPIEDVDRLVAKYRTEGADVTYRRVRFDKHALVAITGMRSALRFLNERFVSPPQR